MTIQHTESVKFVKDYDTFGDPNSWGLYVKTHDGNWQRVQALDRTYVERIVGYGKVPEFKLHRNKVVKA